MGYQGEKGPTFGEWKSKGADDEEGVEVRKYRSMRALGKEVTLINNKDKAKARLDQALKGR